MYSIRLNKIPEICLQISVRYLSDASNRFIKPGGQVFVKDKHRKFIDSLRITVTGGSGGNGYPKYQGIGGNGGNVCLVAKSGVNLFDVKRCSLRAKDGQHSSQFSIIARDGSDLEIKVPTGITVILDQYQRTVAELNQDDDRVIVAYGGRGGDKQNSYCGTKGQKMTIRLDLKLLADVGLVGYPNAGKSTLLRALSRASPKIASYPFTTIQPNLGVIQYDPPKAVQLLNDWSKSEASKGKYYEPDYRRITVADLPGLIDGAHRNLGLGHRFLKHIVRTKLLVFVVDIDGFRNTGGHHYHEEWSSHDPIGVIQSLVNEIDLYDPSILRNKPSILAISKLDTSEKRSQFIELVERLKSIKIEMPSSKRPEERPENETEDLGFKFDKVIGISAVGGFNIERLKGMIRRLIDMDAESARQPISFHSYRQRLQPETAAANERSETESDNEPKPIDIQVTKSNI